MVEDLDEKRDVLLVALMDSTTVANWDAMTVS